MVNSAGASLTAEEIVPTHWYNVLSDLTGVEDAAKLRQARPETRGDGGPVTPQIPLSMYRQSMGRERFVEIPQPVRDEYLRWRPTPLHRARRLEKLLDTPARIYYKYEGTNTTGSHKLNTALAQAYYYKQAGITSLTTGTGAGQWGSALAVACRIFGLKCTVYMVRVSYDQKPYRRIMMEMNGAEVISSPNKDSEAGRAALARDPDTDGSLSIANAEAFEHARQVERCNLSVGSGENHVLLHQTVIGQEAVRQFRAIGDFPDVVIGSVGAGSNFSGISLPFFHEKVREGLDTRFVAVEPEACPKLTKGRYAWDYNDYTGITPMTKMYTLGHTFVSPGIHAGGLRYHGAAPLVSAMYHQKLIEAVAYPQRPVFEAGITFANEEGIIPAPESAHAIRGAIEEALQAKKEKKERVILFNLSGHGLLDLSAYQQFLSGNMTDMAASDELIAASLGRLPAMTDLGAAAR
ncbi:TrpB-like pyridoxal phosphate-dependent enzyme [Streptomyces sp. SID10853]|uniref:TrpB-like pyridoxal phosphate-dependent enzyme n=1 Tax=Streptomyces sp. SID10853 TaxID=2706028 RepID=UPI0013C01BB2|nr:TrpB-like pyridoxal phosphate-dependent enzyme [Streptomyces sp. SID10853]NDZ79503.1 TrpB-like pyridoxal phosphate-dependent enzyme [Streptomyces sp. SID10853]